MTSKYWVLATGPVAELDLLIAGVAAASVTGWGIAVDRFSAFHRSRARRHPSSSVPAGATGIPADRARWLVRVVGTQVAPAVTAALLVYVHTGRLRESLLVLSAFLAGCWMVARFPYPLHLMPGARRLLVVAGPVIGAGFVAALGSASQLSFDHLAAATLGAILIGAVGSWAVASFQAQHPVRAVVIGSSAYAASFAARLREAGIRSHRIVGWLSSGPSAATSVAAKGHLGALSDVRSVVIEHGVELLVCAPGNGAGAEEPVAQGLARVCGEVTGSCLDLPVRLIDANELHEELLGHVPLASIEATWFRYIMHPRYRASSPLFKRLLDVSVALLGGVLALPVLALCALAIKLQDGGPILYRQRRVGERGREFELLKLRTMHLDSEADGLPRWSSADDGRVTAVGRLLRRSHLDELPQLWNVLSGEMAVVGPRPERPELVSRLERQFPHYERRHLVKPGITGWAQVRCGYAGSEIGTAWKLAHDLYYLKHRSLMTELMLIAETAVTVIRDTKGLPEVPGERLLLGREAQMP